MKGYRSVSRLSLVAILAAPVLPMWPAAARPAPEFDHSHALWTEILSEHVDGDRVDYAKLKQDHATLDRYLAALHAVKPDELASWTRDQQYAFWINAYNAHCVALVVSKHPVESIKDIGGLFSSVFEKEFIDMPALHPLRKAKKLSLDDIEHEILRPKFKDSRTHAAVNCASLSCPPLRPEAFVAERLDEQLDEQVKRWLADPARNEFDETNSRIRVSKIFDWYEEDFVRDGGSIVGWIAKHAPEREAAWLKDAKVRVEFLDYSWKLNDRKQ